MLASIRSKGPRLDEAELRKLLEAVGKLETVLYPSGDSVFLIGTKDSMEDATRLPQEHTDLISYLLVRAIRVLEMMEWIRTGNLVHTGVLSLKEREAVRKAHQKMAGKLEAGGMRDAANFIRREIQEQETYGNVKRDRGPTLGGYQRYGADPGEG